LLRPRRADPPVGRSGHVALRVPVQSGAHHRWRNRRRATQHHRGARAGAAPRRRRRSRSDVGRGAAGPRDGLRRRRNGLHGRSPAWLTGAVPRRKDEQKFKRHEKVVAAVDLPGVPAGTKGKVQIVNGLAWIRYWVVFENGAEVGQLGNDDLMTRAAWDKLADRRRRAQREAEAEARRAKYLAGQATTPLAVAAAGSVGVTGAADAPPT